MPEREMHSHWIKANGHEETSGTSDALFPYWSLTKTALAICALKLVEEGVLDLDTASGRPAFPLRQLLAHTSGLPDYGHFQQYHRAVARKDPVWSRDQLMDIAIKDGMLFDQGQGWSYSNIGYMLIKERIEEVTGAPMTSVFAKLIWNPLGLQSVLLAETQAQFAQVHWDAAKGYDPRWVYHGCLVGTAADAARLVHALFAGQLLSPDSFELMTTRRILGGALPGRPWTQHGYGLGLMSGMVTGARRAAGHSGAGPFCVNAVYHFPDQEMPITVACFTDGSDEGIAELQAVVLANTA